MKRTRLKRIGARGKRNAAADRKWKAALIDTFGNFCMRCAIHYHRIERADHAHHIYGKQSHPHLRSELLNGILLCVPCHRWAHENPAQSQHDFLAMLNPTEFARLENMRLTRGIDKV